MIFGLKALRVGAQSGEILRLSILRAIQTLGSHFLRTSRV